MSNGLGPIIKRVRLMLGRGVIRLVLDNEGIQKMQVSLLKNEIRSALERFQEYGFTSNPKPGAEAAIMFLGGMRDHGIIVGVEDRRYRIKGLASGEVAIYTDEGDKIHLKRGNEIEVTTNKYTVNCQDYEVNASNKATFNTPLVRAENDMIDNYNTNFNNLGDMRDIFNIHVHPENDSGGPTDDPNQQM